MFLKSTRKASLDYHMRKIGHNIEDLHSAMTIICEGKRKVAQIVLALELKWMNVKNKRGCVGSVVK
jgi:hypothetical protein